MYGVAGGQACGHSQEPPGSLDILALDRVDDVDRWTRASPDVCDALFST